MKKESEHIHQTALFDLLRLNESKYPILKHIFAIPNGGQRHKAVAAKLKAEGVKAGIFDIFVPIPKGSSHGMFIEMKYGKNKLTKEQNEFGIFAACYGYDAQVCYSWQEAAKVIENYLDIKLQA